MSLDIVHFDDFRGFPRLEQLKKQLQVAKTELNTTKEAARKAAAAANEAKQNVMRNRRKVYRSNTEEKR